MREIAASFAGLLRLLTHDGEVERPADIRDLLVDRLRDALDRRMSSIPDGEATFVAGTFLVEAVVHSHERTIITRLRHRDLGTSHALKTISAARANEAVTKAMLLREAHIGMTLHHPNLVAVQLAIRLADGRPAIIMEWAGPSLSQRLAAGSMSSADIKRSMKSLLLGLDAIHAAGYVHGDISPANLLLCDYDFEQLKIADFGTALEHGARYGDLDIAKVATPGFTAPELYHGEAADPRADLYSVGCVLNMLLAHCSDTEDAVARLKTAATDLMDHSPSKRPPNAVAALQLITEN
ncbi:serine/threonine-protein kinase [Rhizobium sp. RCAM05973]|uniref:serine/threonine-protein kinase n=1 Tax=Rhizobium sp. RCAM05973 TaxID=2994066 RepID=UPI0022EBB605|nr:serine/threonine-protein kinase [Rhizobium sp. RCAM05973]